MTIQETLDEVAQNNGFVDWFGLLYYEHENSANLVYFIEQTMQLYAAQFIDGANEIIMPALDILPETYKEEIDNWCELQNINK